MPFPFGNKVNVQFGVNATDGSGSEISLLEIEAAAAGSGILIRGLLFGAADAGYGIRESTVITGELEIITPNMVSDPDHTLATIIRTGVAGSVATNSPDVQIFTNNARILLAVDLFVPPGKIFFASGGSFATVFSASVIFDEYLDTPGN